MARKVLWLGLAVVFMFSLSGCASIHRSDDLMVQGLKNKVSALETQLQEKEDEINSLRAAEASKSEPSVVKVGKVSESKERPTVKQIQLALKNAGYFQGTVDGKMGKMTRQAIKDFQKANNLSADGQVGKKTWAALKDYLEKKVK